MNNVYETGSYYAIQDTSSTTPFVRVSNSTLSNATYGSFRLSGTGGIKIQRVNTNYPAAPVFASTASQTFSFTNNAEQSPAYTANYTPALEAGENITVGTLTGNITVNNPNYIPDAGSVVTFTFVQNSSGSHTVSWGSIYQFALPWAGINSAVNATSTISFVSNGTALVATGGLSLRPAGTSVSALQPLIHVSKTGAPTPLRQAPLQSSTLLRRRSLPCMTAAMPRIQDRSFKVQMRA